MKDYYYNEKKGCYEPTTEAHSGAAPRDKRKGKVFTAEDYSINSDADFDRRNSRENERFDYSTSGTRPITPTDSQKNRLNNAISRAMEEAAYSRPQSEDIDENNLNSRLYSASKSKDNAMQKTKLVTGLFAFIMWILFIVMKACISRSS